MPISVPSEPKVHTTKYENFRGVDYTNDASNVWYRRSPNGLNMLPDLDGQPFKRNGWKIEFSAQDFIETSGVVGVSSIDQYKVDYFELGGEEFLWFYTSIGCFYYSDTLTFVNASYETGDDKPYDFSKSLTYDVGDYCMSNGTMYKCILALTQPSSTLPSSDTTHWTPTEVKDGETVPVDGSKAFPPAGGDVDYTKSFFFEGGGKAGYYMFVSDKMYMFDGTVLHECKPTIPIVMTMADTNGVGTILYDANMLTEWRAIEYECNGTDKEFKVPDGFINDSTTGKNGILNAYTINADGSLTPKYDWTIENRGALKFTAAPANTRPNQPSLRIVYKSANSSVSEKSVTSSAKNLKVTKTVVTTSKQKRKYLGKEANMVKKNGKMVRIYEKVYSAWKDESSTVKTTYANTATASFTLSNPKKPVSVERNVKNGTWGVTNDTSVNASLNAYGTSVTLSGANNGKTVYDKCTSITPATTSTTKYSSVTELTRTKTVTTKSVRTIPVRIKYQQWAYTAAQAKVNEGRNAFFGTSRVLVFGNGIINQAFLTSSSAKKYNTRVWYSMATDPLFFPDTNYIEVGATDKKIMGLMKVGDYLGIIKQGSSTETSIYLAYATSFEDITTYAVKQSVNGIGAISNGAFNILNDEPLFLSAEGVMGIEPAEDDSRQLRNRSYYINKPLLEEPSIESAISFVFDGMYWLAVNNHCYVLDGSQKTSWENTKTNLQYECYYLENIPAKCFAKKDGLLWFIDNLGNLCRFKGDNDELQFVDDYTADNKDVDTFVANEPPVDNIFSYNSLAEKKTRKSWIDPPEGLTPQQYKDYFEDIYTNGASFDLDVNTYEVDYAEVYIHDYDDDIFHLPIQYEVEEAVDHLVITIPPGETAFLDARDSVHGDWGNWVAYIVLEDYYYKHTIDYDDIDKDDYIKYGNDVYTVVENNQSTSSVTVSRGVPIPARWGTIADDDGSAHYYKKLQKKGSLVALMPMSDSGVKVYLIPDEQERIFVGETDAGMHILPFNVYLRKKVKKYKRLQIVCENDSYNDGFGIDEIIKSYTLGNYAKK